MRPFDDYDSGEVQTRQRGGNQRSGGSETQYRAKPFTDLVDEDKHAFVKRRVLSTVLGGYRIVVNEVEETYVGVGLHVGQILICLLMPVWISVCVIVFGLKDARTAGCIAGGAVPLVINLVLMGTSYRFKNDAKAEDDEVSCCSKAGFSFLFPAKSSLLEVAYCALLTFSYGALMTYAFHPATMMSLYGVEQSLASSAPQLILIGLSSYSLFSHHCPESAIYRDNDQELDWGSNHYQRVIFYILIAVGLIVNENASEDMKTAAAAAVSSATGSAVNAATLQSNVHEYLYLLFIVVYVLQVFGLLSHPLVNIFWAAEQVNIHVFGSTARASDARIVVYFLVNAAFIAICYFVRGDEDTDDARKKFTLCTVLLSYLASHNIVPGLVRKPYKVANERLRSQRQYAEIVFAGKRSGSGADSDEPSSHRFWIGMGVSLVHAIILAAMAFLIAAPKHEGAQTELGIAGALYWAALVLFVVHWLLSATSRFSVFRVIPCPQRQGSSASTIASRVIQIAITLCLTPLYIQISGLPAEESGFMRVLRILSIYRAFGKLFHNPLGAVIESAVCLFNSSPIALTIAAFGLNRLYILIRKLVYVMVSVITALKNTKQRFSGQAICFALQFTIFLPLTLGVILVTALLDTATIPYLGFAFFIIGYPKPQRGWSSINPVEVNPNDSRSDGHLYQAMLSQLSAELQRIIGSDPFNFGCGSFYFMKNEKMILLIQVLERGNNYIMITVKGTELQETTVCHAEENDRINQITEEVFDKKQRNAHFAFSLSPLKQINFGVYDDQKVSMSGIIENPEFEMLVKRAYVRVLLLKLGEHFRANRTARLVSIFSSELSDKELRAVQPFEDRSWIAHLRFDHHSVQFSTKRLASDAASAQSFSQNKVQPAGYRREPERSSQPVSFLNRVESEGRQQQTYQRASRETANRARRSEDRQSLPGDRPSFGSDLKTQGVAARPAPQSYGVVPAAVTQSTSSVPKRPVKAQPADDLDELEDMLAGLEGGSDDLDDLLDDLGPPIKQPKAPAGLSAKYRQQEKEEWKDELDELEAIGVKTGPAANAGHADKFDEWDKPRRVQEPQGHVGGYPASPGARTRAEPSASSGGAAADRLADWDRDVKRTHSPLHARARTPRSSHSHVRKSQDHGTSDIERFVVQSFTLLFGDEFQNMPLTLLSIFKGNLKRNFTNRDFLDSNDIDALHLKYIMLHSARLAFHYSLEAFIMGEMELPDYQAFEDEIRGYDQEWFLGSEEYLWNAAIERKLPNLERLIQKKDGQYVAHRLKFGQSAESTFSVFEFRREVIRGIWANLNMELLYYTNANDERFSIQAEKDILRNLLVQLAEVPLGYPVFSSGAYSITI